MLIDLHKPEHMTPLIGSCWLSVSKIEGGMMLFFCMQSSYLKSVVCRKINSRMY